MKGNKGLRETIRILTLIRNKRTEGNVQTKDTEGNVQEGIGKENNCIYAS